MSENRYQPRPMLHSTMSVWIYSPTSNVRAALHRHVEALGFIVDVNPERATVVLVDLSSYLTPLPPPPEAPSIALLGTTDARTIAEAEAAGYDRVVLPTEGEEHLRYAVTSLLAEAGDRRLARTVGKAPEEAPNVTQRERDVLDLLMLGLTNKRIAKHLGITERTVKFHVAGLMRKHRVSNRLALMLKNPIVVTRVTGTSASLRVKDATTRVSRTRSERGTVTAE